MGDILSTLRELRSIEERRTRGALSPEDEARFVELQHELSARFPPIANPSSASSAMATDAPFVDADLTGEPTETRTSVGEVPGSAFFDQARATPSAPPALETPFNTPLPAGVPQAPPFSGSQADPLEQAQPVHAPNPVLSQAELQQWVSAFAPPAPPLSVPPPTAPSQPFSRTVTPAFGQEVQAWGDQVVVSPEVPAEQFVATSAGDDSPILWQPRPEVIALPEEDAPTGEYAIPDLLPAPAAQMPGGGYPLPGSSGGAIELPSFDLRPDEELTSVLELPAPPQAFAPAPSPTVPSASPFSSAPLVPEDVGSGTYCAGESRVVVHTLGGVQKRGAIFDADLNAEVLDLVTPSGVRERLPTRDLKAVFFMVPIGQDVPKPRGRPVTVTLQDGRQLDGLSPDYAPGAPGFFLHPTDQRARTARIYLYAAAVREIA